MKITIEVDVPGQQVNVSLPGTTETATTQGGGTTSTAQASAIDAGECGALSMMQDAANMASITPINASEARGVGSSVTPIMRDNFDLLTMGRSAANGKANDAHN